ncbi:MAG: hypothetical protein ACTSUE_01000 [Promethearchaeota archaeon]
MQPAPGPQNYKINLHYKNKGEGCHTIELSDFVPDKFSIVGASEFHEVQSRALGKTLMWKLVNIAPGEERAISYIIHED